MDSLVYCLFRIHFLVSYLLNKVHVEFDAFDSSCCSYVHKNKNKNKNKKNSFALGTLGLLSNLFLKTFLSFLQRIQFFFSKAFFSKEHKKIHLTKLLPNHDD